MRLFHPKISLLFPLVTIIIKESFVIFHHLIIQNIQIMRRRRRRKKDCFLRHRRLCLSFSLDVVTCFENIQITSFFFSLLLVKELGVSKYDVDWKYADVVFLLLQQMVFISFSPLLPIFYMFRIVRIFSLLLLLSFSNRIQFLDHLTYIDSVYAARFCFSPLQLFFSHTYSDDEKKGERERVNG